MVPLYLECAAPPTREEWEWLQSLQDDSNKVSPPSELVKVFQDQLRSTVAEFLQELAPLQKVSRVSSLSATRSQGALAVALPSPVGPGWPEAVHM